MRPARITTAPLAALLAASTLAAPASALPIDSPADPARADSAYALPRDFHTANVPGNDEGRGPNATYALPRGFRPADVTDAIEGRGTFTAPDVTVINVPQLARPAHGGLDWADAGIGAGGATGLLAITLAGALIVRRRQMDARARAVVS
jgi:hypothetical protein